MVATGRLLQYKEGGAARLKHLDEQTVCWIIGFAGISNILLAKRAGVNRPALSATLEGDTVRTCERVCWKIGGSF